MFLKPNFPGCWLPFRQVLSWLGSCGLEIDLIWVLVKEPSIKGLNLFKAAAHKQNKYHFSDCFLNTFMHWRLCRSILAIISLQKLICVFSCSGLCLLCKLYVLLLLSLSSLPLLCAMLVLPGLRESPCCDLLGPVGFEFFFERLVLIYFRSLNSSLWR